MTEKYGIPESADQGWMVPPAFVEEANYYAAEAHDRYLIRGGTNFICQVPVHTRLTRPTKERSGVRRGAYRVYAPGANSVTDTKGNAYVAETRMAGFGFDRTGWWEAMGATTLNRGDTVTAHYAHCGRKVKINKPKRFLRHMWRAHGLL